MTELSFFYVNYLLYVQKEIFFVTRHSQMTNQNDLCKIVMQYFTCVYIYLQKQTYIFINISQSALSLLAHMNAQMFHILKGSLICLILLLAFYQILHLNVHRVRGCVCKACL